MVIRFTRSCILFVLVVFVVYFTSILSADEADLPQWARSIKHGNWTEDVPIYELQFLKQELYGALDPQRESTATWPQHPAKGKNASEPSASPSAAHKPQLPAVFSGPSPYAYVFPIISDEHCCAALVNIDRLVDEFHTSYRIIALTHGNINPHYLNALRKRNVTLQEAEPPRPPNFEASGYKALLKLRAFWLHQADASLKRVLVLDPDVLILQSLDSVFDLPPIDLAAPRAYWSASERHSMSATLMLISLSDRIRDTVDEKTQKADSKTTAESIINSLFVNAALILPGSYDTQTFHWDKWSMPDWFRPEEVVEMEEAGRFTGSHGLVKQGTSARIAALGWAIARWKTDFEDPDEYYLPREDAQDDLTLRGTAGKPVAGGQTILQEAESKPTARRRSKRSPEDSDHERSKMALLEAQKAAVQKAKIQGVSDQSKNSIEGEEKHDADSVTPDRQPEAVAKKDDNSSPPSKDKNISTADQSAVNAEKTDDHTQEGSVVGTSKDPQDGAQDAVRDPAPSAMADSSGDTPQAATNEPLSGDGAASTQYFSDMPLPTNPGAPASTTSEPEPTPTVIDKGALERPLYNLHRVAHLLHFREGEKPWERRADEFRVGHEEAHELWVEHYKQWRQMAKKACPAINTTFVDEKGSQWKEERLVQDI